MLKEIGSAYVITLRDMLSLVMEDPPSLNEIWGWSGKQQHEAESWAGAVYLAASDNPVKPPPRPSFLS